MDDYLDQIEAAANDGRFYYLALTGALAVPDICGALESNDGEANGPRYKAWFDAHMATRHAYGGRPPILTGEDCWRFRCSFLHQGSTQHPTSGYARILFIEPGATGNTFHMNVIGDALNIDVRFFCVEMVDSARRWLGGVVGTEPYQTNFDAFVHRYPVGLAPYIRGVPVIS